MPAKQLDLIGAGKLCLRYSSSKVNSNYASLSRPQNNLCPSGQLLCKGDKFCADDAANCPITDFKLVAKADLNNEINVQMASDSYLIYQKTGDSPVTKLQWGYQACLNRSQIGSSSSNNFFLNKLESWKSQPCTSLNSFTGDNLAVDDKQVWLRRVGEISRLSILTDNVGMPQNYPATDDQLVSLLAQNVPKYSCDVGASTLDLLNAFESIERQQTVSSSLMNYARMLHIALVAACAVSFIFLFGSLIIPCCFNGGEEEPIVTNNRVVYGRFRLTCFANFLLFILLGGMTLLFVVTMEIGAQLKSLSEPYALIMKAESCFDELIKPEVSLLKANEYAHIRASQQLCDMVLVTVAGIGLICFIGLFVQVVCCSGCYGCFFSLENKLVKGLQSKVVDPDDEAGGRKRRDLDGATGAALVGTTMQQITIEQMERSKQSCPILDDGRQRTLLAEGSEEQVS